MVVERFAGCWMSSMRLVDFSRSDSWSRRWSHNENNGLREIVECTTFDRQMSRVGTNRTAFARFPADELAMTNQLDGNKGFGAPQPAPNLPSECEGPALHAAPGMMNARDHGFVPYCHFQIIAMRHRRIISPREYGVSEGAEIISQIAVERRVTVSRNHARRRSAIDDGQRTRTACA
jgi:hypothetical protein